jgi:hypothetical protein
MDSQPWQAARQVYNSSRWSLRNQALGQTAAGRNEDISGCRRIQQLRV